MVFRSTSANQKTEHRPFWSAHFGRAGFMSKQSEIEELKAEIERMHAENQRLLAEIGRLHAQIETLKRDRP